LDRAVLILAGDHVFATVSSGSEKGAQHRVGRSAEFIELPSPAGGAPSRFILRDSPPKSEQWFLLPERWAP
jgi:hypothetical protein